jgi:hypothetical protein
MIKDSGNRTEFTTGAVRDMHEDKGRCDLMPLDVVSGLIPDAFSVTCKDAVLECISEFQHCNEIGYLYSALRHFGSFKANWDAYTMILETAKHFEQGAKKYGEYNWQKGIPTKSYIDSAVRHYLKHLRGDTDERHDRAFVWNLLCCIWTCKHKPELNDYRKDEENVED